MITIITDEKQIKDLHNKFHKRLSEFLTENIKCDIGHAGGTIKGKVKYSSKLKIWIAQYDEYNRFWNGFGLGRPQEKKNNSITGEINFPFNGINRKIAGTFAKDEDNNILVLHRGIIGGSKIGIGKKYFLENFRDEPIIALDGDKETIFCLVGELNSPHFPEQVKTFIEEIGRIKNTDDKEKKTTEKFAKLSNFNYRAEHFGKTTVKNDDTTTIDRTHGIVVGVLAEELKNKGYQVSNNKNMDLFIHKNGLITTLFEIKTGSNIQSLCGAAGQLIIYSTPIKNKINLIAVLPDKLSSELEKQLSIHGIIPVYYKWSNGLPIFEGIDSLLKELY